MSFVSDQVRRIDAQLDRFQLLSRNYSPSAPVLQPATAGSGARPATQTGQRALARITRLQTIIKSLSTGSSSQPQLSSWKLQTLIAQAQISSDSESVEAYTVEHDAYQEELEWLLVSKATAQIYGLILNSFLDQIIPLSNDIWYWDDVLGSYAYSGFYTLQTSPLRFWDWSKDIYRDAWGRLQSLRTSSDGKSSKTANISERWKQFYGLVRQSIQDRSIADVQSRVMSPLTMARIEARRKQRQLGRLREMSASGLGVLIDEALGFDVDDDGSTRTESEAPRDDWKNTVVKSIALMERVLANVTSLEHNTGEFEDLVFAQVEDTEIVQALAHASAKPTALARKLQQLLEVHMPNHAAASRELARQYGRPSRMIRYWLPATVLLLSSSTLLRILVNRQAEIATWIRDLGQTTIDFWYNWILEPVKKVIGTIRHDKDSEIAIMSKESLQGDRASLERMVVDFAVDHPDTVSGTPLSDAQVAEVRSRVREGDLTPVLRAYERDLRKPLIGTIRGDLIRALLIQVQKTKVDVEVAIGGIDSLLKSQELVFGFVGLTPGVLVCIGVSRWLASTFSGRNGGSKDKKQDRMVRVLRNIDRILTASRPSSNGMLNYKDHGLLLCEVHVLRQHGEQTLPGEINREFLEEINDLVDIKTGVERQLKVVERVRWAYWKWMH